TPRRTPTTHSFPTRRSSDLPQSRQLCGKNKFQRSVQIDIIFSGLFHTTANSLYFKSSTNSKTNQFPIPFVFRTCFHSTSFLLDRSEEHTSELQSRFDLVCRL